jgi:hypothetical protein
VSGVVMDSTAILSFLNGDASELLPLFESGVLVSSVTLSQLEWTLIRSGGKRLEVRADLSRLGLDAVEFSERHLEFFNAVGQAVPGLEFEAAVAAGLARGKRFTLVSGNAMWSQSSLEGLTVQLVGSARVVPAVKPAPIPSVASVDGGVGHETRA